MNIWNQITQGAENSPLWMFQRGNNIDAIHQAVRGMHLQNVLETIEEKTGAEVLNSSSPISRAYDAVKNIEDKNPRCRKTQFCLAYLEYHKGSYPQASSRLKRLGEGRGRDEIGSILLASTLMGQQKNKDAVNVLLPFLDSPQKHGCALSFLAVALAANGDRGRALNVLNTVASGPSNQIPEVIANLANVSGKMGRVDHQDAYIETIMNRFSELPLGYAEKGSLLHQQNNFSLAKPFFELAIQKGDLRPATKLKLIQCLAQTGEKARSRAELDDLIQNDGAALTFAYNIRAQWRQESGDLRGALHDLDFILNDLKQISHGNLSHRAEILFDLGQHQAALKDLNCIHDSGWHSQRTLLIAALCQVSSDPAEARDCIEKVYSMATGMKAKELHYLAKYYMATDEPSKAVGVFEKLLKLEPHNLGNRAEKGILELALGHYENAYGDLKVAFKGELGETEARRVGLAFAKVCRHLAWENKSHRVLLEAMTVDFDPDINETLTLKGRLYALEGDHQSAVQQYGASLKIKTTLATLKYRMASLQKLGMAELALADATQIIERQDAGIEKTIEELSCPISMETLKDPVTMEDGFTYERSSIQHWMRNHRTSPMTRADIGNPGGFQNLLVTKVLDHLQGLRKS